MKRGGGEVVSLIAVVAVTAATVSVFPLEALRFGASRAVSPEIVPAAAFVFLDETTEGAVMRAAKDVRRNVGGEHLLADLAYVELPESPRFPLLSSDVLVRSQDLAVVGPGVVPFQPSLRAPPSRRIAPESAEETLAFPRSELLKLK